MTAQDIFDQIDHARECLDTEPDGILCSAGVYGVLQQHLAANSAPFHQHTNCPPERGSAEPDMYVMGIPLWCIQGYPHGRVDLVGLEAVEDSLRFVGRWPQEGEVATVSRPEDQMTATEQAIFGAVYGRLIAKAIEYSYLRGGPGDDFDRDGWMAKRSASARRDAQEAVELYRGYDQ